MRSNWLLAIAVRLWDPSESYVQWKSRDHLFESSESLSRTEKTTKKWGYDPYEKQVFLTPVTHGFSAHLKGI